MSKLRKEKMTPLHSSGSIIDIVPAENLVAILLNLSPTEIINFCKTERRIKRFCTDDGFWEMYAHSRGIKLGYSKSWEEAVKKSHLKYSHVDLTSQLSGGYAFDIEYAVQDGKLLMEWHSEVPFIPGEKETFDRGIDKELNRDAQLYEMLVFLSYLPEYTVGDKEGTIKMVFRITDMARFNEDFNIVLLAMILLISRRNAFNYPSKG
jgi:hypothetical protein